MRIKFIKCPPDGGLPEFQLAAPDYCLEDLRWLKQAWRLGRGVNFVEPEWHPAGSSPTISA